MTFSELQSFEFISKRYLPTPNKERYSINDRTINSSTKSADQNNKVLYFISVLYVVAFQFSG